MVKWLKTLLKSHSLTLIETVNYYYYTRLTASFSGTTQVSRYQKGKTNLDFTEANDSEWQWHPLGRMQVCTSLQTDNHASIPPLSFFTGRMPFLPPNQQRQSTEGRRQVEVVKKTYLIQQGRTASKNVMDMFPCLRKNQAMICCFNYHISSCAHELYGAVFIPFTHICGEKHNLQLYRW